MGLRPHHASTFAVATIAFFVTYVLGDRFGAGAGLQHVVLTNAA
ncbi:hypothetical protein [Rhizobium sp. 10PS4]|nr:hypothetical protein [Rhizobium sp. 10PS4]MDU0309215.1 hypothetical protein [Rhizobium sp. 10PS4]